jgi:predicted outer membrane protein
MTKKHLGSLLLLAISLALPTAVSAQSLQSIDTSGASSSMTTTGGMIDDNAAPLDEGLVPGDSATPLSGEPVILTRSAVTPPPITTLDQVFVTKATDANLAEIAVGRLALQRSTCPQVRALAQQMINDHCSANAQLQAVAQEQGIILPPMIGTTHQAVMNQLQMASGPVFDKLFMSSMVEDHENAITLFATEAASGSNPALRTLAGQLMPTLVRHAQSSYTVASIVGAPAMAARPAELRTAAGSLNFF